MSMKHCDSKWHKCWHSIQPITCRSGMKSPKLTSFCLKILDLLGCRWKKFQRYSAKWWWMMVMICHGTIRQRKHPKKQKSKKLDAQRIPSHWDCSFRRLIPPSRIFQAVPNGDPFCGTVMWGKNTHPVTFPDSDWLIKILSSVPKKTDLYSACMYMYILRDNYVI